MDVSLRRIQKLEDIREVCVEAEPSIICRFLDGSTHFSNILELLNCSGCGCGFNFEECSRTLPDRSGIDTNMSVGVAMMEGEMESSHQYFIEQIYLRCASSDE